MAEEPPAASSLRGLHSAATRRLMTFMTGEHLLSPQYSTFFLLIVLQHNNHSSFAFTLSFLTCFLLRSHRRRYWLTHPFRLSAAAKPHLVYVRFPGL
jgi:hypothetical protein